MPIAVEGFATIQAAVTAAGPGDRIVVCAGTYHEQVDVSTNDLRIEAEAHDGSREGAGPL